MQTCSLCGLEVESFEDSIERWVLSVIKQQCPEWGEEAGACRRCVKRYENLGIVISLVQSHDLD
jgi:hypothetical protein